MKEIAKGAFAAALALFCAAGSVRAEGPGWWGLTPGMELEETLAASPGVRWTAASAEECRAQLPEKSCWLLSDERAEVAGRMFEPMAIFAPGGRLGVLSLKHVAGGTAPSACAQGFSAVLAALEKTYGRMSDPFEAERPPASHWHETPLGGRYYLNETAAHWPVDIRPAVTNDIAAYRAPYPEPARAHVALEGDYYTAPAEGSGLSPQSCILEIEFKARFAGGS